MHEVEAGSGSSTTEGSFGGHPGQLMPCMATLYSVGQVLYRSAILSQYGDKLKVGCASAGFYVSYNNSSLEPNITAAVRNMAAAHPGAPLYVIGHSMGAALATICAMDVKFKANLTDVHLYTFGSPRVGNDIFASFVVNQTTVRFLSFMLYRSWCDWVGHMYSP